MTNTTPDTLSHIRRIISDLARAQNALHGPIVGGAKRVDISVVKTAKDDVDMARAAVRDLAQHLGIEY